MNWKCQKIASFSWHFLRFCFQLQLQTLRGQSLSQHFQLQTWPKLLVGKHCFCLVWIGGEGGVVYLLSKSGQCLFSIFKIPFIQYLMGSKQVLVRVILPLKNGPWLVKEVFYSPQLTLFLTQRYGIILLSLLLTLRRQSPEYLMPRWFKVREDWTANLLVDHYIILPNQGTIFYRGIAQGNLLLLQ